MQKNQNINSPTKTSKTNLQCSSIDLQNDYRSQIDLFDYFQEISKNKPSETYFLQNMENQQNGKCGLIIVQKWTIQDQIKLIRLHRKLGNQWTLLAKYFPGNSQNFIKNHFYSRLRKSIRKLNKIIGIQFKREYTKFKLNIIFKLSNISQEKISDKQKIDHRIFDYYKGFLYDLINFSISQDSIDIQSFDEDQSQKIQEKKPKIQTESLILSLIALENLFRLIRGQRAAKGKKKNIAYLRQLTFKINLQTQTQMVISKQKVYFDDVLTYKNTSNNIQKCQKPTNSYMKQQAPTGQSYNQQYQFQNLLFSTENINQVQIVKNQGKSKSINNDRTGQKECSYKQGWYDYFNQEIREFDIFDLQQNINQTGQKQSTNQISTDQEKNTFFDHMDGENMYFS